jgi:cyclopropane fatty-acyl-phospholipid synthase-like methyltransferase
MTDPKRGSSELRPDTFNRHVANIYPALAMLAGMQLDVFTPLGSGPKTVDDIAHTLGVSPRKLRPLMYALVVAGLLTVDNDVFANTAETDEFFVAGKPRYLGGTHGAYADLWSATLHTAASIRSDRPQAKHDFSRMSYPELRAFMRGLDAGAAATARRLERDFGLSRLSHVLDAGGGAGGLAIELCRLAPALHATIAELANVVPVAREHVGEVGLDARIAVLACDLVAAPPPGHYDAVVMRSLLQVLSADAAAAAVKHCVSALRAGGGVYVVGRVLDDSRLAPLDAVAANVMFLSIYDDGQAYTESEYRAWFAAAGLSDIARREVGGGYSIVSGRKT